MEQSATNKVVEATPVKKEITFWNKPSTRLLILIGIIFIIVYYFTKWVPMQECKDKVIYQPAVESLPPTNENPFSGRQGFSEHYSFAGQKFKSLDEAVSYCARNN